MEIQDNQHGHTFDYKHALNYARNIAFFWNTAVYAIPLVAVSNEINLGYGVGGYENIDGHGESVESSAGFIMGSVAGIAGLASQIYVHSQLISHGNKWGGYAWIAANLASIPLAIWFTRISQAQKANDLDSLVVNGEQEN